MAWNNPSTTVTVDRGHFVLGLQPDDRMPNDWLRMVARVFAAYRLTPLEKSIVAYIDGYHLNLEGQVLDKADISISPGTAFVDDQFVGFMEESTMEIDKDIMVPNEVYAIVLCYTWINIMPPQKPTFDIIVRTQIDPEHMLELGTAVKDDAGNLTITDNKRPWFWQMIELFIGDAEVDGIDPDSLMLPYLIQLKESEEIDIGYAIDFHRHPGNHIDYDIRLDMNQDDLSDENLYINGNPIMTMPGENSPYNDIQDLNDKFMPLHINMRLVDSNVPRDGLYSRSSDSGFVNYELVTYHPGTGDPNGPHAIYNDAPHGSKLWHDHDAHHTHLSNYYNFDDPRTLINDFMLSDIPGEVMINGSRILTENYFGGSSDALIFFLGKFANPPFARRDGTPVQEGDQYYDTTQHSYYYWEINQWSKLGAHIDAHECEFIASDGQTVFECSYNPDFVFVSVEGINIPSSEYIAIDGTKVILAHPTQMGQVVKIYTVSFDGNSGGGGAPGPAPGPMPIDALTDVDTTTNPPSIGQILRWDGINWIPSDDAGGDNGSIVGSLKQYEFVAIADQTTFDCEYNPHFVHVSLNGIDLASDQYMATDGEHIIFNNMLTAGDIVKVYSILDSNTGGSAGIDPDLLRQYEWRSFMGQTEFDCIYNPNFLYVSISGVELSANEYTASDGQTIILNTPTINNELVKVYSVLETSNNNPTSGPRTYDYTAVAGQTVFTVPSVFTEAAVFTGGILNSTSEYTIQASATPDSTDIIFNNPKSQDTWISITAPVSNQAYNFMASDGQTTFIVPTVLHNNPCVFVNGIRSRDDSYTISIVGSNTNVTFNSGKAIDTWVLVKDSPFENVYNFEATAGQRTFTISGTASSNLIVYTDGIVERKTDYTINVVGTNTNIIFNNPKSQDTWILVNA